MNDEAGFSDVAVGRTGETVIGYESAPVDRLFARMFDTNRCGFACTEAKDFKEQLTVMAAISKVDVGELASRMTLYVPTGEADLLFEAKCEKRDCLETVKNTLENFLSRSSRLERLGQALAVVTDEMLLNLKDHVYSADANAKSCLSIHADPGGIWIRCFDSVGAITQASMKSAYRRSRESASGLGGYGMSVMLAHSSALHICSQPGQGTMFALRMQDSVRDLFGKHFSIWARDDV